MRHRSIIRALQGIRTRKGKNRKRKIEKKISRLQQKANNIANDSMNRIVHIVTKGVDKVAVENLSYEFTSSGILCTNHINCRDQLCVNLDTGELIQLVSQVHGGNRKRSMNRTMRENRVGGFLHKLGQK